MASRTTTNGTGRIAGLVVALVVGAIVAALPASAGRRVEVYRARHRTADELLPFAATVLGAGGEVALDPGTDSLVLIGDEAAVAEALELLATQDRALRTIVLRHATHRLRELSAKGISIRWQVASGGFRLGSLAAAARGDSALELRARQTVQRLSASLTAQIRVAEGGRTRIETGTTVPHTVVGRSGSSTQFVDATSGFEAGARILANGRIQVDLASFARELLPGGPIGTTTGSSSVSLQPGVVVAIAGLESQQRRHRIEPGNGAATAETGDETVVLIRADVE